jgi:hypothetical protein
MRGQRFMPPISPLTLKQVLKKPDKSLPVALRWKNLMHSLHFPSINPFHPN